MARTKKSSFDITEGIFLSPQSSEKSPQAGIAEASSAESAVSASADVSSENEKPAVPASENRRRRSPSGRRSDSPSQQGRKGEKAKRSCIAFSDINYDFIKRESLWNGKTYSEFLDEIINDYRKSYKRKEM